MLAFLSYATADRDVAHRLAASLKSLQVEPFLAHDDIDVSAEWRDALLDALGKSHLFIPILSVRYFESIWCTQESGIAAALRLTFVPLSIDQTVPQGFFGHVQSVRIDPAHPPIEPLVTGMAKHSPKQTTDLLIKRFAGS